MQSSEQIVKAQLFGVNYSCTDYEQASDTIIRNAEQKISFGVSALAVHGLITSTHSKDLREKLKKVDLIVPDGQPVRWALNFFFKAGLKDRVYGPTLTLHVLRKANDKKLSVFLYGSTSDTIEKFITFINKNYPYLTVSGIHPDRFRDATVEEDAEDIKKINDSGAHIVLVGRGCPRQEIWVADHKGKVNAPMMAVGAAFNFCAGNLKQAPKVMQDLGLEWLFRLCMEPGRLWQRYLVTNSVFILLCLKRFVTGK